MMLVLQCQGAFRDVAEMEDIEIGCVGCAVRLGEKQQLA